MHDQCNMPLRMENVSVIYSVPLVEPALVHEGIARNKPKVCAQGVPVRSLHYAPAAVRPPLCRCTEKNNNTSTRTHIDQFCAGLGVRRANGSMGRVRNSMLGVSQRSGASFGLRCMACNLAPLALFLDSSTIRHRWMIGGSYGRWSGLSS